jgi:OPA family glycerol-3-phosphate transporter-like MFS transporter
MAATYKTEIAAVSQKATKSFQGNFCLGKGFVRGYFFRRCAGPETMTEIRHAESFATARVKTLVAVMFCYLFYYTGRQSFGFAIPGITQELGLTKAQLGWCSTAMLWAYAIGQAINGQLADRFGGKTLMTLGGILSFVMNVITSFAGGLFAIKVPWALNGFAQSLGWAPGSRILSNWWEKQHRGVVYGWYLFAAGMSSVVTFGLCTLVLKSGLDWRWIFRLPVILMLVGSVVFWLVAKEKPQDAGHAPLPDEPGESPVVNDDVGSGPELSVWDRYRTGLTNVPFMIGCMSIGFQNLARYGLLIWVPVHFLGKGFDKNSGTMWVSMALPIGMALGAVSAGLISDSVFKGKRSSAIIIFLFLAAIFAGGLSLLPHESVLAIPLLFLAGFFVYGPQSGYWALCPDLLGRRLAGTGTGIMNFFAYLFAGLGEPLIGKMIDQRGGDTSVIFTVIAVACALGAILMSFIRKTA